MRRVQETPKKAWKPAMSDGCSVPFLPRYLRDRPLGLDISKACIIHDRFYYYGGWEYVRAHIDEVFRDDIIAAGKSQNKKFRAKIVATIFFQMVRKFGGPERKQPYSWGFGKHPEWWTKAQAKRIRDA